MLINRLRIWQNSYFSYIISVMRGGKNRRGFTIIELLLATAIFSTVLMVVISGFLQIGRLFYKGVTLTNTQQTARSVLDSVSNDIRFNPAFTPNDHVPLSEASIDPADNNDTTNFIGYYCVGNVRYTFHLHHIVPTQDTYGGVNNASDFGLLRDNLAGSSGCSNPYDPDTPFNNPKELLSPNMRLNDFSIDSMIGQVYDITVDVVNGDNTSVQIPDQNTQIAQCTGNLKNSQYCAESRLSTSVSVNTGALNASNERPNGIIVKKTGKGHGDILSTLNCGDNPTVDCSELGTYDNIACGATCQVVYPKVVIAALDVDTDPAHSGHQIDPYSYFQQWTFSKGAQGCIPSRSADPKHPNAQHKCYVNVQGGIYTTATFGCKNPSGSCDYTLNVSNTGQGSGTISSDQKIACGVNCSQKFDIVTKVVLTASAGTNSKFNTWNYACTGKGETKTKPTCTVNVNKPIKVTAKFDCTVSACSWAITASKLGTGGGTIQSTPDPSTQLRQIDCGTVCNASFSQQTTISVTAIPADDSVFKAWTFGGTLKSCDSGNKTDNPCSITIKGPDDVVKATFNKK